MKLLRFIDGFAEVVDGLIHIISFGFIDSHMIYTLYMWHAKRKAKKQLGKD